MRKILRSAHARVVCVAMLTALFACSGEIIDGSGSSGTALNSTGRFLMNGCLPGSPGCLAQTGEIEGLAYAGGVSIGTTNVCAQGIPALPTYPLGTQSCYGFQIGQLVRFGLGSAFQFGKGVDGVEGGGIGLGELATPRAIMTLVDLWPAAEDETDLHVSGFTQFLLTEVTPSSRNAPPLLLTQTMLKNINDTVNGPNWAPIDFTNQLSLQCAVDLIGGVDVGCNAVVQTGTSYAGQGTVTLTTPADAQAILAQTLRDIYEGCYRGTLTGDATGSWAMFVDDDGTIDQVTWPDTAAAFTGAAETKGSFAAATPQDPESDVSLSGTLKSGGDYRSVSGAWTTETGQQGTLTGSRTDEAKGVCI